MKPTSLFLPAILLLGVVSSSLGWAQEKKYVLMAPSWGPAQDQAVIAAGGTVEFSHTRSGLAIARSSAPDFLKDAVRGKTIDNGAEDQVVQWVEPLREVVADGDLEGEAVTPGDETFINEQW
ncbi:MAG TPA: hypothetical protein VGK93_11560, partial [Candidatus Eisenbacteria bacterium]